MTINNPEEYVNNLWNWKILDGCFGDTKIRPTDIDGLIERKGKFLLIETKSPNVEIDMGQKITFENLAKIREFSVLLVWGKANKPEKIIKMTTHKTDVFENASLDTLRCLVSSWFKYANE